MAERRMPELLVEQIALDELNARARARLRRRAGAPEIERRLETIRRSDEEILSRYPAEEIARQIRERAAAVAAASAAPTAGLTLVRPARVRRFTLPLAVAAAAVLAVALLPRLVERLSRPENLGIKGSPTLLIYRQDDGDAVLLPSGARAQQGDRIQIKYMTGGRTYGAIVSIDGRGSVTLHYPASAGEPTDLVPEGAALDYAYVLDDAPEFERFFMVTSPREFSATVAIAAAEKLARRGAKTGSLDLPAGFEQASTVLAKGD